MKDTDAQTLSMDRNILVTTDNEGFQQQLQVVTDAETSNQHVLEQVEVPDISIDGGGYEAVMVEVGEDGTSSNVVYIVQQGVEMDNVTYTVTGDDNTGQTYAVQAVTDANTDAVNFQSNEDRILQAISSGQFQVVESSTVNQQEEYCVEQPESSSSVGESLLQPVSVLPDTQVSETTQYITIQGTDTDNITGNEENVEFVFTCQYCDKSSSTLEELKHHLADDHNASGDVEVEEQYTPAARKEVREQEDTRDFNEAELKELEQHDNLYLKCPYCTKVFSIKWHKTLQQHMTEDHAGKPSKKPQLIRTNKAVTSSKQNVKVMMKGAESTDYSFACYFCEQECESQQDLVQHIKEGHVGLTARQFELASKHSGLDIKQLCERDEASYPCILCDRVFKWPKSLKSHMVDFHKEHQEKSEKKYKPKDAFFKCMYCNLVTKYACSVRKHIERKHPEMVKGLDINKLDVPRVHKAAVSKSEVMSLDKRPAEVRLKGCIVLYRCPFCSYATQLPSNMARHLTCKTHNYIFSQEELKKIKVKSFRVTREGSEESNTLPELKLSKALKEIIDVKKASLDIPAKWDNIEEKDGDKQDNEEMKSDKKPVKAYKGHSNTAATNVPSSTENSRPTYNNGLKDKHNTELTTSQDLMAVDEDTGSRESSSEPSNAEDSLEPEKLHKLEDNQKKDISPTTRNTPKTSEIDMKSPTKMTSPNKDMVISSEAERKSVGASEREQQSGEKGNTEVEHSVKCVVCSDVYDDIQLLIQHASSHENMKVVFCCLLCHEEHSFFSTLTEHCVNEHSLVAEDLSALGAVRLSVVETKKGKSMTTYDCPYCEMLFSQAAPLKQHVTIDHAKQRGDARTHGRVTPTFNCYFCELSFPLITGLVNHMQTVHPGADRQGIVEENADSPMRKSSRKRKLPKWLENDMDMGTEVKAKVRKLGEMPVRLSSTKSDTAIQSEDEIPVLKFSNKPTATKKSKTVEALTEVKKDDPLPEVVKSPNVGRRGRKRRQPVSDTADTSLHTKESSSTNAKEEIPKKVNIQQKSPKQNPSIGRVRRKLPVEIPPQEVIISEHKCPHCNFTAKRSSALSFHINFNHKTIKLELDEDEDEVSAKEDTASPRVEKRENAITQIPGTERSQREAGEQASDACYIYNASEAVVMEDSDIDQEYIPDVDEDYKPSKQTSRRSLKSRGEYSQEEHKCSYCKASFISESAVKSHVKQAHSGGGKATVQSVLSEGQAYTCTVCPVLSNTVDRILMHIEVTHPLEIDIGPKDIEQVSVSAGDVQAKFLCPYCPFKSVWRACVPRHVQRHHPNAESFRPEDVTCVPVLGGEQFMCPYCMGVMETRADVVQHAAQLHSSRPQLTEADIEQIEQDDTENLLKCPYCDTHSKYKRNIVRHIKRVHPELTPFDASHLKDLHKSSKVYRCAYCCLESEYKNSFLRHMQRQHPEITDVNPEAMIKGEPDLYSCRYCSMQSSRKDDVTQHIKLYHYEEEADDDIESEMKQSDSVYYRCPVCKMSGRSAATLVAHMKDWHSEEDTTHFHTDDLLCEMKVNDDMPNMYVCKYCKQGCKTLDRLIQHSHTIHGKTEKVNYKVVQLKSNGILMNVYNCPCCKYTALWRRTVMQHVQNVHIEASSVTAGDIKCTLRPVSEAQALSMDQYICPYCDVAFKWKKSVLRHMKRAHPNLPEDAEIRLTSEAGLPNNPGSRKGTKLLQCTRCKNTCFRNIPSLRKHYSQFHPEHAKNCLKPTNFQYVYTSLPASTVVKPDIQGAVKEHHRCMICGAMYLWKKSLLVHVKSNHSEQSDVYQVLDKMVNLIADSVVNDHDRLVQHGQQDHTSKPVKRHVRKRKRHCGLCSAVFKTGYAMWAHYTLKHGQNGRKRIYRTGLACFQKTCRTCGLSFFTASALLQHKIKRHCNRRLTHMCGNCAHKFPDKRRLLAHKLVCLGSPTVYTCPVMMCNFRSRFNGLLHAHQRNKHATKTKTSAKKMKCEICWKVFENATAFKQHIMEHQQHRLKPFYRCDSCPIKLPTRPALDEHIKTYHPHLQEMCDICGETFVSKLKLQSHLKKHSQGEEVNCPVCDLQMIRSQLSNHYIQKHSECLVACECSICLNLEPVDTNKQVFTCQICMMNFCRRFGLLSHNQLTHGAMKPFGKTKKTYECKICKQVFFTQKSLHAHVGSEHNIRHVLQQENQQRYDGDKYEPLEAEKLNTGVDETPTTHVIHIGQGENTQYLPKLGEGSLSAVIKELMVYDSLAELPYKCVLCGRCFSKSKYIKLHIRRSHVRDENQPYRCKICGSGFVRLTEFRKHTRSHSDFRPYKCKFCNKAFKQQANLKEHYFTHGENRQYHCYMCQRSFRQRGALTSHVVGHDTLKPFKCMFCGKGFTTRGELSRHMKKYDSDTDRQEKSYSCHMCLEAFSHFPLLLKHIDQHNPEKPFHCQVCNFTVSNYVALYFHKVKEGHLVESEIVEPVVKQERKSSGNRKPRKAGKKPVHIQLEPAVQETVYLSHVEDGNILQNTDSTIEVIIEELDHSGVVQIEEKQPEHEELLSIAQQLTELSSIAEKGYLLKEEDEIIKSMLDADADILANLNKNSSASDQKWEEQTTSSSRRSTVRDYLVQPVPEVGIGEERDVVRYMTEVPNTEEELVTEDGQVEMIQIDGTSSVQTSLPTNMEELASLISQNTETGQENNVLAYQNEDGSVIYVCMPDREGEPGLEIEQEVIETVSHQDIVSSGMTEGDMQVSQNIYTAHPTTLQPSDHTAELETAAQHIANEINIVERIEQDMNDTHTTRHVEVENAGSTAEDVMVTTSDMSQIEVDVPYIELEEGQVAALQDQEVRLPDQEVELQDQEASLQDEELGLQDQEACLQDQEVGLQEAKLQEQEAGLQEQEAGLQDQAAGLQDQEVELQDEEAVLQEHSQVIQEEGEILQEDGENYEAQEVGYETVDVRADTQPQQMTSETVEEYQNDETTFIKEELLDVEYQQAMEKNEDLMVMYGNFKYTFIKDEKCFCCLHCDAKIANFKNLKGHLKRHVPERRRQFLCKYCNKRFVTNNELKRHVKVHLGERDHVCKYCNKAFVQAGQLTEHIRTHTGEKPYRCRECDTAFTTSSQCKQHWRRIHGEKTYACNQCDKCFKTMTDLMRHKGQMHSSMKKAEVTETAVAGGEHVCHICGQSYERRGPLMSHLYRHAMENVEFKCTYCEKSFKSKESLTCHIKAKHAGFEHVCTLCGEAFSWKRSLQRHLQLKHDYPEDEPKADKIKCSYNCDHCDKVFSTHTSLVYHMGSKHVK